MNLLKTAGLTTLYLAYLGLTSLALLEIIFRLLPVSESTQIQPVNVGSPVAHFRPNREITNQIGFNFSHVVQKKINNYGFMSDLDFHSARLPDVARTVVIGDSYVEAFQVSNSQTFHGILDAQNPKQEVYALGLSGAPLSQYLVYAEFAEKEFNPDSFIINVIGNDFDESFLKYKNAPPFQYFDENGALVLSEFEPNALAQLMIKSALVRYLYFDLKVQHQISRIFRTSQRISKFDVESAQKSADERQSYAVRAVSLFLEKLGVIVGEKPVLFVLDTDRKGIYRSGDVIRSPSWKNQAYEAIVEHSSDYPNFVVLDLHAVFLANWRENGERFEYLYDSHWNEWGHRTVAEAIQASGFLSNTLSKR